MVLAGKNFFSRNLSLEGALLDKGFTEDFIIFYCCPGDVELIKISPFFVLRHGREFKTSSSFPLSQVSHDSCRNFSFQGFLCYSGRPSLLLHRDLKCVALLFFVSRYVPMLDRPVRRPLFFYLHRIPDSCSSCKVCSIYLLTDSMWLGASAILTHDASATIFSYDILLASKKSTMEASSEQVVHQNGRVVTTRFARRICTQGLGRFLALG